MPPMASLPTPSLLLDATVLERNARRMSERMRALGVGLRPHLKTAKSARIAELATRGHDGGITVSTLAEAEYFFERGVRDLTYAVVMAPAKIDRAAALAGRGAELTLLADGPEAARAIGQGAARAGVRLGALVEVDTGDGRTGLPPDDEALLEVAAALDRAPGVELRGVLTHGGHSYDAVGPEAIREVARAERDGVVRAAERLRAAGLPCPVVSAGSTPTAVHAEDLSGVTEMRPGVYLFNDLKQLSIGACERSWLALSVLGTVISHVRQAGQGGHLVLDTGALALSKDLSANEHRPEVGYGEVCAVEDLAPLGLYVRQLSQEHGIVPVAGPEDFERLPVGAAVRIVPNHACLTAAAYDRYRVIEHGAVVGEWERLAPAMPA